ncbi:cilia- and flagella-associated protein 57-like [Neoarius graeffei]|uniref:cilia- and flagella-associated protein 57-like n=1 Tax=Neoarius graeffei TaxID=443677 RepID=UPI00298D1DBD|nr:cilia- and flagella-associated protein 57-like [Neoarius graeffei]
MTPKSCQATATDCTYAKMASFGETSQIHPCHVFGMCKGVRNNLIFPDETSLIFPSGKQCVCYSVLTQQCINFFHVAKEDNNLQALALSPDRNYLAVSEAGKSGTITIFQLENKKYQKIWVGTGSDFDVQELVCMAFSANSKYLLVQAGEPTWTLYYWEWEKNVIIATVKFAKSSQINQVSFNPEDDTEICVNGKNLFRIFKLGNESLIQADSYQLDNDDVLCHLWMSKDCIIAGTESGKLLMLESRNLHTLGIPYESETEKRVPFSLLAQMPSVTGITKYSAGFACSAGTGLVCLYEQTDDKSSYRKTVEIMIPVDQHSSHPLQEITTICISSDETILAISTNQGQLYCVNLTSTAITEKKKAKFKFLSHSLHSESITGMSICMSKPLVTTCSMDYTIHIWNFQTNSLEQFKEFDDEPLCVAMHPNGHSILVGFTTEVWLMKIFNYKIIPVQTFAINACTECVFNHDGNMFAAIEKNVIYVYNIRTFEKLDLMGHRKKVQSVKWSEDDRHLVSCGLDGNIYVWNTLTGVFESKNETRCTYADLTFLPNTGNILAVDHVCLKELRNDRLLSQTTPVDVSYTAIAVTCLGKTVFIGTAHGTVRIIKYPFRKETTWTEHQAHSGPITKMIVTPGDQFLLTASKDGSLLIWKITDPEGRKLEMVKCLDYSEEVLCTKAYLEETEQNIHELKTHNKWLELERSFQLNVSNLNSKKKAQQIMQNYLEQTDALKDQIQLLNNEKKAQKNSYEKTLTKTEEDYTKQLKDQEINYSESMTVQYQRNLELQEKMKIMQQNYERLLQEAEDCHLHAMEDSTQSYEAKLQQLQAKLEQQVKNSEQKQMKMKDNAEAELKVLCCDYEHDLQMAKEAKESVQLDMKIKEKQVPPFCTMKREINDQGLKIVKLEDEVQNLTDQLKHATDSVKDLTKEKQEKSKIIGDQVKLMQALQEKSIKKLHKKMEKMERILEQKQEEINALFSEKKTSEEESMLKNDQQRSEALQLKRKLEESKEECELLGDEFRNEKARTERIIAELTQKLKTKKHELYTERQRNKQKNIQVERMKCDIHKCSNVIHDPKELKKHFRELHNRHIHQPVVTMGVETEDRDVEETHVAYLQRILKMEKSRWEKALKIQNTRNTRLMMLPVRPALVQYAGTSGSSGNSMKSTAWRLQALLTCPTSSMSAAAMVPQPEKFSREVSECKVFLLQCSLYFTTLTGVTEEQKIAQFINLLTGNAMKLV